MPDQRVTRRTVPKPLLIWLLGFVAVVAIGGSLTVDLSGESAADRFILARWSFDGLRVYLWLEALVLVAIVAGLGLHVVSVGLTLSRNRVAEAIAHGIALHPRISRQAGYMFVVLGAALVALSLTTLVLFNSCGYMRLV